MEAYRVLSKPDTRKDYDIDMQVRPVYARRGFANAEDAAYMQYECPIVKLSQNWHSNLYNNLFSNILSTQQCEKLHTTE